MLKKLIRTSMSPIEHDDKPPKTSYRKYPPNKFKSFLSLF